MNRTHFTVFLFVLLSLLAGYSHQSQQLLDVFREKVSDATSNTNEGIEDKLLKAVEQISNHIEKVNEHYLKKLDDKFESILDKIGEMDVNVKILQEKAQVWNIFSHHVDKWIQHSKQVDQKIDSLKSAQDTLPIMNNQLQNTDFKVQQIFQKVELINEKLKTPGRGNKSTKKNKNSESLEDFDESEIMSKLNLIQRTVQQIQRQQTPNHVKINKNSEFFRTNAKIRSSRESHEKEEDELKELMKQLQSSVDKIPVRDIKQSYNLNRKQEKTMENLSDTLRSFEEETLRHFIENVDQVEKLQVASLNNRKELLGLSKKIEGTCGMTSSATVKVETRVEKDQQGSGEEPSGDQSAEDDDFQQPDKSFCYQLKSGASGLYTFGQQRNLNEGSRDFNQQYCEFATEGPAWLVMQRRGDYEVQENFNRSWNDYKIGFGDLNKDFWIGNDYIHKLTYEENMVLRVEFEGFSGNKGWMEYSTFRIESEKFRYNLIVEGSRGSVPDGFLYHNDSDFSTFDQKNDLSNSTWDCSQSFGNAGWWFNNCAESCLNGVYQRKAENLRNMGLFWDSNDALMSSKMMIRPRDAIGDSEFLEVTRQISSSEEP